MEQSPSAGMRGARVRSRLARARRVWPARPGHPFVGYPSRSFSMRTHSVEGCAAPNKQRAPGRGLRGARFLVVLYSQGFVYAVIRFDAAAGPTPRLFVAVIEQM